LRLFRRLDHHPSGAIHHNVRQSAPQNIPTARRISGVRYRSTSARSKCSRSLFIWQRSPQNIGQAALESVFSGAVSSVGQPGRNGSRSYSSGRVLNSP
jgi:hypothetical protein